jgi:hypothetical protein
MLCDHWRVERLGLMLRLYWQRTGKRGQGRGWRREERFHSLPLPTLMEREMERVIAEQDKAEADGGGGEQRSAEASEGAWNVVSTTITPSRHLNTDRQHLSLIIIIRCAPHASGAPQTFNRLTDWPHAIIP